MIARPAIKHLSIRLSEKSEPIAPIYRRSTQAVTRPAPIPKANQGASGTTSRSHDNLPLDHQTITSSAAGNVAVTLLVRIAATKSDIAMKYFCVSRELPEFVSSRSEEHTSELQSQSNLVCRLLLEKKKNKNKSCRYN